MTMSLIRGLQTLSLSCSIKFTSFNVTRMQSYKHMYSQLIHQSAPLNHVSLSYSRCVHTSCQRCGLEEFFPVAVGKDLIEDAEKTGRPWKARELRNKSFEDLHKLWYVLLKERNMLITLKQEANRLRYIIPAPERLSKVKKSMARIKYVISEREKAIKKAQVMLHQERLAAKQNRVKTDDSSETANTIENDTATILS